MTIYKRFKYYVKFRARGKKELFNLLDNEASVYYERCDYVSGKGIGTLYSLMVTNIACEIYEQMIYGFKHMLQEERFNLETIKHMYRISLIYFFICFNAEADGWNMLNEYEFVKIARLRPKERRLLKRFAELHRNNEDLFELEFLKYYSKMVFGKKILNPYTVALAGNILYNSYQGFTGDYCHYMRRMKIA